MPLFRHLLLVMSLSGSLVVLLYLLIAPLSKRWFPHGWRKRILQLALFFYLFPMPLHKDKIRDTLDAMGLYFLDMDYHPPEFLDTTYVINQWDGRWFVGSQVILIGVLTLCGVAVAGVWMARQLRRYRRACKGYTSAVFREEPPPWLQAAFEEVKQELGVRGRVRLVLSRACASPMSMGFLVPTVVFPVPEKLPLTPEEARYILKHELYHIKHRDIFTKFLALLALGLHWFNPLCHLLYRELCVVCELDCDYGVVRDQGEAQRKTYSHLILNVAFAANAKKEEMAAGLTHDDVDTFRRRLTEIKNTAGNKVLPAALALAILCAAGMLSVLVYDEPRWAEMSSIEISEAIYVYGYDELERYGKDNANFLMDHVFTEDRDMSAEEVVARVADCEHEFYGCTSSTHEVNDEDGSCVVRVQAAQQCARCFTGEILETLEEEYYPACPHGKDSPWGSDWD